MTAEIDELVTTVERLMRPYRGSWALAGGWALDSWLNRVTRVHGDIDIAVFLDEQRLLYAQLTDWRLVAHETDEADHQTPWDGHELAPASHLHANRSLEPTRELLINERDLGEGTWTLRRFNGPTATLPLARFALPSPWGLPTVAPEAIAFYKLTGELRPRDQDDVGLLSELLDAGQRAWLDGSVLNAHDLEAD